VRQYALSAILLVTWYVGVYFIQRIQAFFKNLRQQRHVFLHLRLELDNMPSTVSKESFFVWCMHKNTLQITAPVHVQLFIIIIIIIIMASILYNHYT